MAWLQLLQAFRQRRGCSKTLCTALLLLPNRMLRRLLGRLFGCQTKLVLVPHSRLPRHSPALCRTILLLAGRSLGRALCTSRRASHRRWATRNAALRQRRLPWVGVLMGGQGCEWAGVCVLDGRACTVAAASWFRSPLQNTASIAEQTATHPAMHRPQQAHRQRCPAAGCILWAAGAGHCRRLPSQCRKLGCGRGWPRLECGRTPALLPRLQSMWWVGRCGWRALKPELHSCCVAARQLIAIGA